MVNQKNLRLMKRATKFTLDSGISRSILVLSFVIMLGGCMVFVPNPAVTQHRDKLVVMETPFKNMESNPRQLIKICREFYRHYEDVFDALVLISHKPWLSKEPSQLGVGRMGEMVVVRNSISGTGTSMRDFASELGSEHQLKGIIHLESEFGILGGSMLHEFMHLWMFDLEVIPTRSSGHWGFSSVGGLLGGFQREELQSIGDEKYVAGDFSPLSASKPVLYSELEMYLAGWIPPSDVPDVWVAEDGAFSLRELTEETLAECMITSGPYQGTLDGDCIIETDSDGNPIFTASKSSTWSIEQIIEKLGPRVPNHEHSQKEFRVAFIYLADGTETVSESRFDLTEFWIEQFTSKEPTPRWLNVEDEDSSEKISFYNSWEATRGIATMEAGNLQSFRR